MGEWCNANEGKIVQIDEGVIKGHLNEMVRGTVEETLNQLLDAEAQQLCNAERYERTEQRRDSRARHYTRGLHTTAGEVRNVSVLVAIGVGEDGYRKVLGIAEGEKEDKAGRGQFLRYLKQRGLKGVKLFISDACLGL